MRAGYVYGVGGWGEEERVLRFVGDVTADLFVEDGEAELRGALRSEIGLKVVALRYLDFDAVRPASFNDDSNSCSDGHRLVNPIKS